MLNRDFTPATVAPLQVILPKQEIRHHRYQWAGRYEGHALPPVVIPVLFSSYPGIKNYHEKPTVIHHVCLSP